MLWQASTTCALVRTSPPAEIATPEPVASPPPSAAAALAASMVSVGMNAAIRMTTPPERSSRLRSDASTLFSRVDYRQLSVYLGGTETRPNARVWICGAVSTLIAPITGGADDRGQARRVAAPRVR